MNGWQVAADHCWLAGLDERRRAEIKRADMGEDPDSSYNDRAGERHDDDTQMRPAVGAVHGMVHNRLPVSLPVRRGNRG